MNHHPEQQSGEIYMGNATFEDVRNSRWKSGRMGVQTLMKDGTPFKSHESSPWFIKIPEVTAAIGVELARTNPDKAVVRCWSDMVERRSVSTG